MHARSYQNKIVDVYVVAKYFLISLEIISFNVAADVNSSRLI